MPRWAALAPIPHDAGGGPSAAAAVLGRVLRPLLPTPGNVNRIAIRPAEEPGALGGCLQSQPMRGVSRVPTRQILDSAKAIRHSTHRQVHLPCSLSRYRPTLQVSQQGSPRTVRRRRAPPTEARAPTPPAPSTHDDPATTRRRRRPGPAALSGRPTPTSRRSPPPDELPETTQRSRSVHVALVQQTAAPTPHCRARVESSAATPSAHAHPRRQPRLPQRPRPARPPNCRAWSPIARFCRATEPEALSQSSTSIEELSRNGRLATAISTECGAVNCNPKRSARETSPAVSAVPPSRSSISSRRSDSSRRTIETRAEPNPRATAANAVSVALKIASPTARASERPAPCRDEGCSMLRTQTIRLALRNPSTRLGKPTPSKAA